MIIGVLSDTHEDRMNAIPYVVKEFKKPFVAFLQGFLQLPIFALQLIDSGQ